MKIKYFLLWILCGSASFILTACYGGPVRIKPEQHFIKINNDTIKGLDYQAFENNNKSIKDCL